MVKKGVKNNIWKQLVRAKVQNQAALLNHLNSPSTQRLNRLASNIKIGDLEKGKVLKNGRFLKRKMIFAKIHCRRRGKF